MGAGPDLERTVFLGDLVDHQQRGDQIVIRMRGKREILMPFDSRRRAGKFGVHLGVMQFHIRPDEVGDHIGHRAVGHHVEESVRYLMRGIDPAKRRLVSIVAFLDIEPRLAVHRLAPAILMLPAFLDPATKVGAQGVKLLCADGILDHEIAIGVKELDLLFGEHRCLLRYHAAGFSQYFCSLPHPNKARLSKIRASLS